LENEKKIKENELEEKSSSSYDEGTEKILKTKPKPNQKVNN